MSGAKITIDALNWAPYPEIAWLPRKNFDGKTFSPKYRARKHELIIALWFPDYADPHSNADSFAHNPDNRDDSGLGGKLAWRISWFNPEINAMTENAAKERDLDKRKTLYLELQRKFQMEAPFTMMFQASDQVVLRKHVKGFVSGTMFDHVFYRLVTK